MSPLTIYCSLAVLSVPLLFFPRFLLFLSNAAEPAIFTPLESFLCNQLGILVLGMAAGVVVAVRIHSWLCAPGAFTDYATEPGYSRLLWWYFKPITGSHQHSRSIQLPSRMERKRGWFAWSVLLRRNWHSRGMGVLGGACYHFLSFRASSHPVFRCSFPVRRTPPRRPVRTSVPPRGYLETKQPQVHRRKHGRPVRRGIKLYGLGRTKRLASLPNNPDSSLLSRVYVINCSLPNRAVRTVNR